MSDEAVICSENILWRRACLIQKVRDFFIDRGYLEVDTPLLQPFCIPEGHIEPAKSGDCFLQPSPELAMKTILADGHPRIFQICRCFRAGERGGHHLPEFTMLEWYRTSIDYRELMGECEELLKFLASSLGEGFSFPWKESIEKQWPRTTVAELFREYGLLTPEEALREDLFEEILVDRIEPHLGLSLPVFVYDYPAVLGSLARLKPGDDSLAERFELYVNGLELANGFSELVDSREQRLRFEKERQILQDKGINPGPMPEDFLASLDSIPPAAGIALGIDRLIMISCGLVTIDEAVAMVSEAC